MTAPATSETNRILVISVHPDDETLGCGGSLLHHQANGGRLFWLIMTQPFTPQYSAEIVSRAAQQVNAVAGSYGMEKVFKAGFPTARLDTVPQAELIAQIQSVIDVVRPSLVYEIHRGDVHSDHRAVADAVGSVLKAFHMRKYGVRRLLAYETLSSTESAPPEAYRTFVPNVYQDISPYLNRKLDIMALYGTEAQADLMPRGPSAIRALARYRGATIGVEYAEAFMLVREVAA